MESTSSSLDIFDTDIDAALQPIIDRVQAFLRTLEGKNLGSFTANETIVARIREVTVRLGKMFRCPSCGEPSKLRCRKPPRMENGVFQFDHTFNGKPTNHGGYRDIPVLDLVDPPEDRRKKKR
jgi:predicted RNA-binding Zn-ribbon protein involved in translation (DUF1610 family)